MINVCMIGCWFKYDIYSHHFNALIESMTNSPDLNINLVTSNCNCFSSSQIYSITKNELLNENCKIIKIPYAPLKANKNYGLFKYYVVKLLKLNYLFETTRGILFFWKARKANIIHFDQVLRSFGILSFTTLLSFSRFFNKKVIITVHELDPLQEKYKGLTRYYNKATRILVFSKEFKAELIKLGVLENKIQVIPYAVTIPQIHSYNRDQFIFFGGHKLLQGKGFDTLLQALKILESKGKKINILIYVGNGCVGLEEGKKKVSNMGLDKYIIWSEFLYGESLSEAYQKSIASLIPYTGGSGRYPMTTAMANETPVIGTIKADIPEYLGELGIYLSEYSSYELAENMIKLMEDIKLRKLSGRKLRKRAEELFNSHVVSERILEIYRDVMTN